jgi:uncharacterized membrane protein
VVFDIFYVGALELAFKNLGLTRPVTLAVLLASLLGSYVNVPLMKLVSEPRRSREILNLLGKRFYFPSIVKRTRTLLTVNVGGCLVHVLLSGYLIYNHVNLLWAIILATGFISITVNLFSKPVEGSG